MPYNKSKRVVTRLKSYLDDMFRQGKTVSWPSDTPEALARKIREALYAAQYHPEFAIYHTLRDDFVIHARKRWVEAEYVAHNPRDNLVRPSKMDLPEVSDLMEVVGAAIKFREKVDELFFSNVNLLPEELLTLYGWCITETPPWRIINHEGAGLTLTRRTTVNPDLWWTPESK